MADLLPLRFDQAILERLRRAQRIEFYLIEQDARPARNYPSTYTCSYVYLLTDSDELYRIQGYLTEDESGYDDVISIEIKRGWFKSDARYLKRGDAFILDDEYQEPVDRTTLMLYETLEGATIETRATTQTTWPLSVPSDETEFDDAIIFSDGGRRVYVTQHQGPYNILITLEPLVAET